MLRSVPRTVTLVTLLVVAAAVLPAVGVGAQTGDHAEPAAVGLSDAEPPDDNATIRLHRIPNDTAPTALPDHVGLDGPSTPVVLRGNDDLVVTVQSVVLAEEVANASGSNLTERFVAAWRGGSRFAIGHRYMATAGPRTLLDLADPTAVTVVAADAPATYHLVVDLSEVRAFEGPSYEDAERLQAMGFGERPVFYAGFDLFEPSDPHPLQLDPNRWVWLSRPSASVETPRTRGTLLVPPTRTNVTISGTTSIPPSASLTVALVDANTSAVVASERTVPERSGQHPTSPNLDFSVTLDPEDWNGTEYAVRVTRNGRTLERPTPLEVVPCEASLSFENDTSEWGARVADVTLTHGGFVVLREDSVDGEPLGAPEYVRNRQLDEWVVVRFDETPTGPVTAVAVAYRDVNGNGEFDAADEPYRENGTPVTATAVISPPEDATTPTVSGTATTTDEREDTATTATVGLADPTTDDAESVPGFGFLGALIALAALAVLRR